MKKEVIDRSNVCNVDICVNPTYTDAGLHSNRGRVNK